MSGRRDEEWEVKKTQPSSAAEKKVRLQMVPVPERSSVTSQPR
jgi:hypothetical protein